MNRFIGNVLRNKIVWIGNPDFLGSFLEICFLAIVKGRRSLHTLPQKEKRNDKKCSNLKIQETFTCDPVMLIICNFKNSVPMRSICIIQTIGRPRLIFRSKGRCGGIKWRFKEFFGFHVGGQGGQLFDPVVVRLQIGHFIQNGRLHN